MPHHTAFRRVAEDTKANALNPCLCSLQVAKIVNIERSWLHWRYLRFSYLTHCMPTQGRLLCALCHSTNVGGRFGDHARRCRFQGKLLSVGSLGVPHHIAQRKGKGRVPADSRITTPFPPYFGILPAPSLSLFVLGVRFSDHAKPCGVQVKITIGRVIHGRCLSGTRNLFALR